MKVVRVSLDELEDGTMGVCVACGEMAYGVEPDARGYECDCCGKHRVYGLEEALLMGVIDIEDD